MAYSIHVCIKDRNAETISAELVFYGRTEAEADKVRLTYLACCSEYARAEVDGRAIEAAEELPDHERPRPEDFAEEDEDTEDEVEVIEAEGGEAPEE